MLKVNLNTAYKAPYTLSMLEYVLIAAIIVAGSGLIYNVM